MGLVVVSTMVVAAGLIAVLRPLAQWLDLIDYPNPRKAHLDNVPLVGGLGIFFTFALSTLVIAPELAPATAFFIGSSVIVAGGLLDDLFDLRPLVKLTFQIVAVLVMCLVGGVSVQSLGGLLPQFGALELGSMAVPFTVVAAIGVINAVNLSDGLDGLAGFQQVVAFSGLALLATLAGETAYAGGLGLLISSVIGFLIFNARVLGRKRAAVFLGDAGTMFLGFAYVWFAIELSRGDMAIMAPVTALWLMAIPVSDTVTILIRRLSRGRSPFTADKEHLHHVLMMAGFTMGQTVMILTAIAAGAAGIGIAGELLGVPESAMFALFVSGAAVYLWAILRAWTVMRFLHWSICRRNAIADRRGRPERRRLRASMPAGGMERRGGFDRRCTYRRSADSRGAAGPKLINRLPRPDAGAFSSAEAMPPESGSSQALAEEQRARAGG